MKIKIYQLVVLFFCTNIIFAQKTIFITDTTKAINICDYASVYRDKNGNMPFEKVVKQNFQPNHNNAFHFLFSSDVFWFKFQVDNQSKLNLNHWYFLWSDGLSDKLDIYLPQENGTYKVLKGGLLTPSDEKAYKGLFPVYEADYLPPNRTQTFYVRLKSSESINAQ